MPYTGPMEDRIAIRELIETYADAVTQLNAEVWGSTWADDGHWTMPDYPEFPPQTGRKDIVALWVEAMKGFPGIMFEAWPGSIEVIGNRAKVRCYTSEIYDQDGKTIRDRGQYDDECVKIDGRWFFSRRSFRNIHRQHALKGC